RTPPDGCGAAEGRSASAQAVGGRGDEYAGAPRLAEDPLVERPWFAVVVVAGAEQPIVDPQLAVDEVELFDFCTHFLLRGGPLSAVLPDKRQAPRHGFRILDLPPGPLEEAAHRRGRDVSPCAK